MAVILFPASTVLLVLVWNLVMEATISSHPV